MRWARALGLAAAVSLVVSALATIEPSAHAQVGVKAAGAKRVQAGGIPAGIHKIKHIVIIMQENRSFDNYFGTYKRADGIPGLAGHKGKLPCVPGPEHNRCWHPYHDTRDWNRGGPHSWPNVPVDVDHGKMDGFIKEMEKEHKNISLPPEVMGYHTGKDIANYWKYANDFVLQDHMFEPVSSWSLPAHLYLMSLWSAYCPKLGDAQSCRNAPAHPAEPPGGPKPTKGPFSYAWTDLTYLLHKHHVTWRYYIFKGIEPDCESNTPLTCRPVTQGPKTNSTWNPLRYFTDVKNDHQRNNIQSPNGFFNAANKGTLVFLMGVGTLAGIAERLMAHGRAPETPAAVVQWGTMPQQRVVEGTLATIAARVRAAGLGPPAVTVVGAVAGLRAALSWWERRPLAGKRVLVTRAQEQASALSSALRARGAQPLEFPVIQIAAADEYVGLDAALADAGRYDWAIFTSANAVRQVDERLRAIGATWAVLQGVRLCAIGPKTAAELRQRGCVVELVPRRFVAEAILDELPDVASQRVLLARADISAGVEVSPVVPDAALEKAAARDRARAEKDWATADTLRAELQAEGWIVEDGQRGTTIRR